MVPRNNTFFQKLSFRGAAQDPYTTDPTQRKRVLQQTVQLVRLLLGKHELRTGHADHTDYTDDTDQEPNLP